MSYPEKIVQLLKENKTETAVKLLVEVIDHEPDEPLHYVNLGTLLFQHHQHMEAEQLFLKAIELDENVATAYFGLANIYYEHNKLEQAEKALQKCISLQLEDSDVYYLLGMIYVKRKLPLFGLPYLQRATEINKDVRNLFQYGLALAQTNHLNEAKNVLEETLQLDDQHEDALYNLAIIYIHQDQYEKGHELLLKVISLNPNHRLALHALEQIENYK